MKYDFQQIDLENFSSETACLQFIADQKWTDGFVCRQCGHTNYCAGKKPSSRRCTRCKKEESATANTLFHRCHIPITEAFRMVYLVCKDPSISSYELSRQMDKRQMTCWKMKSKLIECIEQKGSVDILFNESRKEKI